MLGEICTKNGKHADVFRKIIPSFLFDSLR